MLGQGIGQGALSTLHYTGLASSFPPVDGVLCAARTITRQGYLDLFHALSESQINFGKTDTWTSDEVP